MYVVVVQKFTFAISSPDEFLSCDVVNTGYNWSAPKCKPRCQNGGVCVADGQCQCARGYKGIVCQNRELHHAFVA